jgi:ABC-type antimicrobial peptide transport system permease subunit
MAGKGRIPSASVLLVLLIVTGTAVAGLPAVSAQSVEMSLDRIESDLRLFSSLQSRFTGYPGSYTAAEIISERFRALNLSVTLFNYTVMVPYDEGSWLRIGERTIEAFSLYPNGVATGEKRASGKLVYAGRGAPSEFDGLDVKGNIVLLEFNSGDAWTIAMSLGASAVVFLEDGATTRYEAMAKISSLPITMPRLYVRGEEAAELRQLSAASPQTELFNGMEWKEVQGVDVVGEMKGTEDPSNVIIVTTHYDSVSVVPAISPGADDAIGIASMLEFIRVLRAEGFSPKCTVWFVAMSGHWQGLSGAIEFVENNYFTERIGQDVKPYLAVSLELTSGTSHTNLVLAGWMYGISTNAAFHRMLTINGLFRDSSASFEATYPDYWAKITTTPLVTLAGITSGDGFKSGMAFKYNFDMEAFELANSLGLGIVTYDDARLRFFTASDELQYVDLDNVAPQCEYAAHLLKDILQSPISLIYSGSWDDLKPVRIGLTYTGVGFATLYVEAVEYSPTNPGLYNAVPNTLILVGNPADPFSLTVSECNSSGVAELHGMQPVMSSASVGNIIISGYQMDEEGRISYASDRGPNGQGHYRPDIQISFNGQKARAAVFRCGSATVFDISAPDNLAAACAPSSLYQTTNAYATELARVLYETPLTIGVAVMRMPGYASLDSWGYGFDPVLGIIQIYAPPKTGFAFMIKSSALTRTTTIFANVTLANQDGFGYSLAEQGDKLLIDGSIAGMLRDPLTLAYGRYLAQADIQVFDPTTQEQLGIARELNQTIWDDLLRKDYGALMTDSLLAWGYSVKAYDSALGVLRDAVTSIIITFALAIPFVLLFVALVYGLTKGLRSVVFVGATGITVSLILTLFHPGFKLAANVLAIFMGTLSVALVIPVLFFLLVDFSSSLSELRREVFGAHFLERSGFDVSFSSVSIGVSNLRKRKFRTALTMISIILVSFALASLTSVTEIKVLQVTPAQTSVKYNGIILHTPSFFPLDKSLVSLAAAYLANGTDFASRYWVYTPSVTRSGGMGVIEVTSGNRIAEVNALVGISPLELDGSFTDYAEFLNGTMFSDSDVYSALIPNSVAQNLNAGIGDEIVVNGIRLKVVGTLNTAVMLEKVRDSDGWVDVLPMNTYDMSQKRIGPNPQSALGFSSVIFVPSKLVELIPEASLTSLFIPAGNNSLNDLKDRAEKLFSAFVGLEVYLTYNGTVYQFTKQNVTSLVGFQFIAIPMIIAGLITMSTILGGVMERLREGYIYSSLGLGPLQVGLMFLGENVVYAIVGSMVGYLSGMSVSYLLRTLGVIQLTVNYTSSSVSVAIGSVIVLVLVASLYPLYKISTLVTPSLERKWRIPTKPKGDVWDIPIPFRIKDDEKAGGIAVFVREYLWNNRIERTGVFTVETVDVSRTGPTVSVTARVQVAPYEQGIRQDIVLAITKSITEQRYLVSLNLRRVSGSVDSWVRFSYPFIDEMRKQMLVWSLLTPEEEGRYVGMARDRNLIG